MQSILGGRHIHFTFRTKSQNRENGLLMKRNPGAFVSRPVQTRENGLLMKRIPAAFVSSTRQNRAKTVVSDMKETNAEHLVLMLSRSARQSKLLLSMPLKSVQRAQVSAEQIVFANLSKIVPLPCKEEAIPGYSSVGLLIIDEPARVPDELYHAVRPMLAASDGRIICLSTPFGRVGFRPGTARVCKTAP
jgi:hypothetical protein